MDDNGRSQPARTTSDRSTALREHDLVFHIVKNPQEPPEAFLLMGFAGRSAQEGHTRLYLDLLLSSFVELPDDAILHVVEIPASQSPLGGHYVWVRRDEELVQQVRDSYQKMTQVQQDFVAALQPGGGGAGFAPLSTGGWPSLTNQF